MSLWSRLLAMFGRHPSPTPPPRDPEVARAADESHEVVSTTRELMDQIRGAAERRKLASARRHYEERLHGTGGR